MNDVINSNRPMAAQAGKQIAADAWSSEGWKRAAVEYDHVEIPAEELARLRHLMSDEISLDRAWNEINRAARERYNEAPKATYDAVVYELRTYGLAQLTQPNCQRRLADLSTAQVKAVIASLQQCRGQYLNVSDELLTTLATIYDARVMAHG